MVSIVSKSSALYIGLPAALLFASALSTRGGGVQSGSNSVPANSSRALQSCASCHSGSAPSASRTNGPTTTLTTAKQALAPSEAISVTTDVTGGLTGTRGGFICEATAGAFTAGTNSRIISNTASITQSSNAVRTWTYTYTAPTAAGLVELTSAGMTSSGSSSSGDRFSFNGFDSNATTATPVRLYVLPSGVTNHGNSCADGYGNYPVLGAANSPAVPNTSFGFQLAGAAPSSFAFMFVGFNPPGFTSLPLGALLGLTGCNGYVASPTATLTALTTPGVAARAEGTATIGFPLPNNATLHGLNFDVQCAFFDTSVAASRSIPLTFTNGLHVAIP